MPLEANISSPALRMPVPTPPSPSAWVCDDEMGGSGCEHRHSLQKCRPILATETLLHSQLTASFRIHFASSPFQQQCWATNSQNIPHMHQCVENVVTSTVVMLVSSLPLENFPSLCGWTVLNSYVPHVPSREGREREKDAQGQGWR